MLRPFPGMDPYLEAPRLWRGFHLHLISHICGDLQPQLVPKYVAQAEETVLLGPLDASVVPDVHVREQVPSEAGAVAVAARPAVGGATVPEIVEVPDLTLPHRFIQIRDASNGEVVTVIEVLSPTNKTGTGHQKQGDYLLSEANLVEVDLLRGGRPTVAVPAARIQPSDYRVCIHRTGRHAFEVVRFGIRDPLPGIAIPLRSGEPDVLLHLDLVLDRCYEAGGYGYVAAYDGAPDPPLSPPDAAWARNLLKQWRSTP